MALTSICRSYPCDLLGLNKESIETMDSLALTRSLARRMDGSDFVTLNRKLLHSFVRKPIRLPMWCKAKRQYLLTCTISRYPFLLHRAEILVHLSTLPNLDCCISVKNSMCQTDFSNAIDPLLARGPLCTPYPSIGLQKTLSQCCFDVWSAS